ERDRDLLRDKFKSLNSRRVEGEVSLGLEQREASDATRIVGPPVAPTMPAAPDRLKLFLVVLALGLAAAVGTGVLLESKDASVRTPAQARTHVGVPLLAVVPSLQAGKRS
ncbi:MAG: chain-length determining protein, partial [Gemmatimonadales bacterium]